MTTYSFDVFRDLYVRTGNRTAVETACAKGLITDEDCANILGASANHLILKKERRIRESRELLAKYLEEHPLKSSCHGGKEAFYNVTEEKQNMFSRKFAAHSALVAAGIQDKMSWNATGCPCEEWTDQECVQFIAEMNAYVTPLVSYQQHIEVAIAACSAPAEVDAISIDYGSLFTTEIPTPEVTDEVQ